MTSPSLPYPAGKISLEQLDRLCRRNGATEGIDEHNLEVVIYGYPVPIRETAASLHYDYGIVPTRKHDRHGEYLVFPLSQLSGWSFAHTA